MENKLNTYRKSDPNKSNYYLTIFTVRKILIFLLLLPFFIYSCKDDPVTPKKDPVPQDTADWYLWDTVGGLGYGEIFDLYVADTDNIYIEYGNMPLLYNGENFQLVELYDPPFRLSVIRGFDRYNVFFGGDYGIPYGDPVLKKWTNGSVTSYSIQNDSGSGIYDILPVSTNQAWIASRGKNNIYYFDNGFFTKCLLDTNVCAGRFYKDGFGNLYVFALKAVNTIDQMYSYKFVNNQFQLVAIDTVEPPSEKSSFLYKCGKDMLMCKWGGSEIFYFNGTKWTKLVSTNSNFAVMQLGGNSIDTVIAFTFSLLTYPQYKMRFWTGTNWHSEKNSPLNSAGGSQNSNNSIYVFKNNIYTVLSFEDWGSYLLIGRPNKNKNLQ